ncbi:unnamed protein product [Rhodiola kirilowii]
MVIWRSTLTDTGDNSLPSGPDGKNRKVTYFYRKDVGTYYYGKGHLMKPQRISMTHNLVKEYGLLEHMEFVKPTRAKGNDLLMFHTNDYVNFLKEVTPETQEKMLEESKKFNIGLDCPAFDDLYDFCCTYAGGSICGAQKLNEKACDIAINWAGGLHHAKRCEASGFCYVNDIVLAILELLKVHERVLYVDIDVHHGDGVEEAFYLSDRVMTVSFHQFEDQFFPGTGDINDMGHGKGKYYALNVPLQRGIDDDSYQFLFKPVMSKVMEVYEPKAVVLQCGADSLYGDRLGSFSLSIKGHGECVKFMRSFNVPLLLLGGGGYTIENVARCWCYETALALNKDIPDALPGRRNKYYNYYAPKFTIHIRPGKMENKNRRVELENMKAKLLHNLGNLQHVPSVPIQERINTDMSEDDEQDMDEQFDTDMMQVDERQ